MKIDFLKVNGFGKLTNKEIEFDKHINIIYGQNEAGKSTMLKFINSMFYGASKNKNGKEISDFDRFKPWKAEEFSGKINYTLDNGDKYEVYRDFKSKVPIIYNNQKQDISISFSVDKSKGIDYIYEQIGVDQETFENTVIAPQSEIAIGKTGQNIIVQKISNLVSSGDENVSFNKTLDKISKAQNEQVGTDRTVQKPINIINNKIADLEYEKKQLEECKVLLKESENIFFETENNIDIEEKRLELFKDIKNCLERINYKSAELDVNNKLINDYDYKIEILENKIDKKTRKNIMNEKKSFIKFYFLILVCLISGVISFVIKLPIIVTILVIIFSIILGIFTFISFNKYRKEKMNKLEEIDELEEKIYHEIKILEKNKQEIENSVNEKKLYVKQEKQEIDNFIIDKFKNKLDMNFIEMALQMDLEEILVSISNKEERINNLKFEMKTKKSYRNQMINKVDNLSKIEEQLENAIIEKEELQSLNNSFNLAKECMESAYEKIRNNINPKFISQLNDVIKIILDNKYSNVIFSDTEGLIIELDDGRYVPIQKLSTGTIDQMYLALRISSINTITDENMPIILDESFVYFDDNRLKNILKFLNENYQDKQIIIFSCSNREMHALEELGIDYTSLVLES